MKVYSELIVNPPFLRHNSNMYERNQFFRLTEIYEVNSVHVNGIENKKNSLLHFTQCYNVVLGSHITKYSGHLGVTLKSGPQ